MEPRPNMTAWAFRFFPSISVTGQLLEKLVSRQSHSDLAKLTKCNGIRMCALYASCFLLVPGPGLDICL